MNESLDEEYLKWLYSQVGPLDLKNPSQTYWSLMRVLYTKEFAWFIPNDDNRVEDGRELRFRFFQEGRIFEGAHSEWLDLPCSVLEMLMGLSDRLAFEDGHESAWWFWHLLDNLDLDQYTDRSFFADTQEADVDNKLDVLIQRQYDYDGRGGLFPLEYPEEDQRGVEIWYQLSAYLSERM